MSLGADDVPSRSRAVEKRFDKRVPKSKTEDSEEESEPDLRYETFLRFPNWGYPERGRSWKIGWGISNAPIVRSMAGLIFHKH